MKYNFDEHIDRWNTNALNTDGFRQYIFNGDSSMKFPYAMQNLFGCGSQTWSLQLRNAS